jgi:hypothetical protein
MRAMILPVAIFALVSSRVQPLVAQSDVSDDSQPTPCAGSGNWILPVSDEPFIASWKQTDHKTNEDGKPKIEERFGRDARDESGRTYIETHIGGMPGAGVEVRDDEKNVIVSWYWPGQPTIGSATLLHTPKPTKILPPVPWLPARECSLKGSAEMLGTKSILGVEAEGMRVTTVVRGKTGEPVTTSDELWYSPEYRLILLSILNDPRIGESRFEMIDFQKSNPDEALFHPPSGYVIKELDTDGVRVSEPTLSLPKNAINP